MRRSLVPALALVLALAGCQSLTGGSAPTPEETAAAESQFEMLKTLEGTWVSEGGEEDGADAGTTVTYATTAGGSALLETVFAGSPHEMVTLYTLDNGRLVLTHYCIMNNQPHMVALPPTEDNAVEFVCDGAPGNVASEDVKHMHRGKLTLVDPGSLHSEWQTAENGELGGTSSFKLRRAD
jgi:hypothetical protein